MEMKDALTENIFEKFSEVIPLAVDQAPGIVTKWGSPVNKIDRAAGGLHFQTYKGKLSSEKSYYYTKDTSCHS